MHKRFSQENLKRVDTCRELEVTVSVDLILYGVRAWNKYNFLKRGTRNGLLVNMVVKIRGQLTGGNFLTS